MVISHLYVKTYALSAFDNLIFGEKLIYLIIEQASRVQIINRMLALIVLLW